MANKFENPWDVGGEYYNQNALHTEFLPNDAAYFTGINPNTGESAEDFGNWLLGGGDKKHKNDFGISDTQKLNSFSSTFRHVLSRMYQKSVYTGNKQEDIDNGLLPNPVKEYMHHFIKMKGGNYREFVPNGEYYDKEKKLEYKNLIIMASSIRVSDINQFFVKRGEKYEIEVHTHPTLDPVINNYELTRNQPHSPEDIVYMPKINDFISIVEAETMQFALIITDRKKAERNFSISKLKLIKYSYDLIYNSRKEYETFSEVSIKAVLSVLGKAKDNGIAFYVNENKSNPNFILQNI